MFGVNFLSFEAAQHPNLWIWEDPWEEGRKLTFHYENSKWKENGPLVEIIQ